ncbi:MAG: hypothetical protein IPH30_15730 [Betaproteobacteria bacterium]|nr:hypothetical protein [Betaproteobacteria bacterium]
MQPNLDPESRRFRAKAAILQGTVLVAVIAGLLVIGARAPNRQLMSMNCAVDTSASRTVSDAMLELSSLCPGAAQAAPKRAETGGKYGVPDAGSVLDSRAEPEPQPPTF